MEQQQEQKTSDTPSSAKVIRLRRGRPMSQDIRLMGVVPEQLERVWPHLSPMLGAVLHDMGGGRMSIDDIRESIEESGAQLFLVWDEGRSEVLATFVTEIVDYPKKRVCAVYLMAGVRMDRWIDHLQQVEAWAQSEGCQQMEIRGRRGWGRVTGYDEAYTTFTRELV